MKHLAKPQLLSEVEMRNLVAEVTHRSYDLSKTVTTGCNKRVKRINIVTDIDTVECTGCLQAHLDWHQFLLDSQNYLMDRWLEIEHDNLTKEKLQAAIDIHKLNILAIAQRMGALK